jgi:hypothetical protein
VTKLVYQTTTGAGDKLRSGALVVMLAAWGAGSTRAVLFLE